LKAVEHVRSPPRPRRLGRWGRRTRNILLAFVAFMVVGNGLILGVSFALARLSPPQEPAATIPGVGHLAVVDAKVWRGAAPSSPASYEALAAAGVTTLVDLRAEPANAEDDAPLEALGFQVVHLPVRDGQTPSDAQIARFLEVVKDSRGPVLVHCGAGVSRSAAVVLSYLCHLGRPMHEACAELSRAVLTGIDELFLSQIAAAQGVTLSRQQLKSLSLLLAGHGETALDNH